MARTAISTARGAASIAQNLVTYSEDFSGYTFTQLTPTANAIANPVDGTVNATLLTDNANIDRHRCYTSIGTISEAAPVCVSAFLKNNTRRYAGVNLDIGLGGDKYVIADLQTGTISYTSSASGYADSISGIIQSIGDGWYRVGMVLYLNTAVLLYAQICLSSLGNNIIYVGNGSSVYGFGLQGVRANWMGPYVKTTGSAIGSSIRSISF